MKTPCSRSPEHLALISEVLLWCNERKGRASQLSREMGRHSDFISHVRCGHNIWSDLDPQAARDAMRKIEAKEESLKIVRPSHPPLQPIPGRCEGRTLAGGEYRRQCQACALWLNGGSMMGAIRPRIVDGRCGQWRPE